MRGKSHFNFCEKTSERVRDIKTEMNYTKHNTRDAKEYVSLVVSRNGQALVEALIAVSVLTVGFLGIATLLSRAISLNRVVADNYTATYLATEGIEVAKNIADGNIRVGRPWNSGFANCSYEVDYRSTELGQCRNEFRALGFDPFSNTYAYDVPVPTTFRRKISVDLLGTSHMRVNSEVTWITRGGGSFSVNLEDHFFNWR